MSTICGTLCGAVLRERFGRHVEQVAVALFSSGRLPLRALLLEVKLPKKFVQKALRLLIRYSLVTYSPGKIETILEYRLEWKLILRIIRFSKYLLLMKKLYGKESEVLVEELLRNGKSCLSLIVSRAYQRLTEEPGSQQVDKALVQRSLPIHSHLPKLRDQFEVLVNKQYIERLSAKGLPLEPNTRFSPPRIELVTLIALVASKQREAASAENTFWTINHERFHQDMRDELLVTAISRRISPQAGEVLQVLLRQAYILSRSDAPQSLPVLITTLRDHCRKAKLDLKHFDEYLAVIAEDSSGFVARDQATAQTAYIVNMKNAIEELTWNVLATTVEIRHGVAAARIFRLIRKEEYIEQDEIQKRAMLPDKECKLLTYSLVQGGWVQQQELRKAIQKSGPTKNFFLFCIDLGQVTRMFLELCYKSLSNCIVRREHVISIHSALIDKQQRIDAIAHHMELKGADPQDISEIKELITPPEAAQLASVNATISKLHQAELEIDNSLFILELYLASRISNEQK